MAKKPEKPINSQKEYEKRLRRVKLKAFLVITIPSIIVLFCLQCCSLTEKHYLFSV